MVRVVSFEPKLNLVFDKVKESGEGVAIAKCLVKVKKGTSSELEIVCGSRMKLMNSPKKFKIDPSVTNRMVCCDSVSRHFSFCQSACFCEREGSVGC